MLKVAHLALTPLAGAPIRIVQALNKYTDVDARLINFNPQAYGNRTFDEDIDFQKERELALDVIDKADIIHCHHWMQLDANPFGIDLRKRLVIRHFHSEPRFIAHHAGRHWQEIVNDPLPQLVIAQHPERYFPNARPVPNMINFDVIRGIREASEAIAQNNSFVVHFSPTSETSAFDERWNTKGTPETMDLLQRMRQTHEITVDFCRDVPHKESLLRKNAATVIIDEMTTGSYHLSALEGMALGKPTLGYLDARVHKLIRHITGSSTLPWIQAPLYRLPSILEQLIQNPARLTTAGQDAAAWMENYWHSSKLVAHFVRTYQDILDGQTKLRDLPIDQATDIEGMDLDWNANMESLKSILSDPRMAA